MTAKPPTGGILWPLTGSLCGRAIRLLRNDVSALRQSVLSIPRRNHNNEIDPASAQQRGHDVPGELTVPTFRSGRPSLH